jgi:hypothetical protein
VNQDVVRRQYLDAMGITAFASRYRLPNALATPACEWDDTPPRLRRRQVRHRSKSC